jgi:hypothetical protein
MDHERVVFEMLQGIDVAGLDVIHLSNSIPSGTNDNWPSPCTESKADGIKGFDEDCATVWRRSSAVV